MVPGRALAQRRARKGAQGARSLGCNGSLKSARPRGQPTSLSRAPSPRHRCRARRQSGSTAQPRPDADGGTHRHASCGLLTVEAEGRQGPTCAATPCRRTRPRGRLLGQALGGEVDPIVCIMIDGLHAWASTPAPIRANLPGAQSPPLQQAPGARAGGRRRWIRGVARARVVRDKTLARSGNIVGGAARWRTSTRRKSCANAMPLPELFEAAPRVRAWPASGHASGLQGDDGGAREGAPPAMIEWVRTCPSPAC